MPELHHENPVYKTEISWYDPGMIRRTAHISAARKLLEWNPVVAILGARQVGKTTLARQVAASAGKRTTRFDLEDPDDLRRLADPMLALRPLKGLVILDEVQCLPGIFSILRVLADRRPLPCRFLVLGSASPELLGQTSESLAGRIAYHHLPGLCTAETGAARLNTLWLRGGFPRSFLARDETRSFAWRAEFVQTFLERDLPQLGIGIASETLRRFWSMLSHWHGQVWNSSEFARSFGVADTTVRSYLDTLTSAFVVKQLQPWHASIAKRQVKSPKIYLADSGIAHFLLGITDMNGLLAHPRMGASWEGFALGEVVQRIGARPRECFFWATHNGAELDLLVVRGHHRVGFEFKRTGAPELTPSMRISLKDLGLTRLYVIHAGRHTFPMTPKVLAVPMARISQDISPLRP
jgi:predicted AAA+ superfamily ATPase